MGGWRGKPVRCGWGEGVGEPVRCGWGEGVGGGVSL